MLLRIDYRLAVALSFAFAGCAENGTTPTLPTTSPSLAQDDHEPRARFIVVFRPGTANPRGVADELSRGGTVHFRYDAAFEGFAATLPVAAIDGIRRNPNVALVEADVIATGMETVQSGATWGLDRIDQRALPLNTSFGYLATGAGVTAYILDTGIRPDHVEFGGRVGSGYTSIADGGGTADCHGHGTHVAGTVGGATYGVAKAVSLVPVRVLDCQMSGYTSGIVAGINWVISNKRLPAVINMSLAAGASASMDNAVASATAAGIVVVVAAANYSTDACTYSPARAPSAITVAATGSDDSRASYSNFGSCVDLFAPGSNITSASHATSTGTTVKSGTSMATPHVAGVAALLLQGNPGATSAAVSSAIIDGTTANLVSNAGVGSPNRLLFSGVGLVASPPPPPPTLTTIAVAGIAGSSKLSGKNWTAAATIRVTDTGGAPVSGATVTAKWGSGSSVTCATSTAGTCALTSAAMKTTVATVTFTVTNLSGTGMAYGPAGNAITSLVIGRP